MMAKTQIRLTAPKVPGADPSTVGVYATMAEARVEAERFDGRRDLVRGDVRIEWADSGKLIEYAGPCR